MENSRRAVIAAFIGCMVGIIAGAVVTPGIGMALGGVIGFFSGVIGYEYRQQSSVKDAVVIGYYHLKTTMSPTMVRIGAGMIITAVILVCVLTVE